MPVWKVYLDSGGVAVIYCRLYRNSYPISHFCNRFKKRKEINHGSKKRNNNRRGAA